MVTFFASIDDISFKSPLLYHQNDIRYMNGSYNSIYINRKNLFKGIILLSDKDKNAPSLELISARLAYVAVAIVTLGDFSSHD
jgi:hypothetical protein